MVKAMIVKICMLLETKGPRQQTKFDPQNGRGLWSRDHFQNFRKTPTFQEWLNVGSWNLVCSQKLIVRCDTQNLTPKVGVAYDHVTTNEI